MQKTKLVSLMLLLTLLLTSCASAQEDGLLSLNTPTPSLTLFPFMEEVSASPMPGAELGLQEGVISVPAAHDCELKSYYKIYSIPDPKYDYISGVAIYDIHGNEIYNETYIREFEVEYVDNCILSVIYFTGTMNKIVTYVDVHSGRKAVYDNPILAGNGVVCVVVPNVDDTKLVYQIYSMFEPDEPILEDEFEAAMWPIPHSAIMNSSFWLRDTIYLTYMLPNEEYEKTIVIDVPEVD